MPAVAASTESPARPAIPAPIPGIRDRLKQATAEAHRDLDARLGALGLGRLDGYRRFLEINAAALLPLEAALEAAGVAAIFTDWPWRSRRAAIAADLARVGGSLRRLENQPALNRNAVFGTLYVLEGSRLGARYLLRTVALSANPVIASATAYLDHGSGQHLWQSFVHALEHAPFTHHDEADIIAGAHLAFSMFARSADRASDRT
jgi:heme oxygenase (biliverdin-IX-beta and delta-forming)